jgi:hypothetical protein
VLLLRQLAGYVQGIAGNDLAKLLSSGFQAAASPQGASPLPKATIEKILNEESAKLTIRATPIPNAKAYELRMSYGANGWQTIGIFTNSQRMIADDLTPGTMYNFQLRGIGGSNGYGDWSDPTSHMSL